MTWQVLVAISVLTYSISVLLQRLLLKDDKVDSVAFSVVFQLFVGVLVLAYALVRGFSVPNLGPLLPNLALMVVLYGAGNVFIFKALKAVEASEFTIVFATRPLWTILAAIVFLGESFSARQLLGTAFILVGVALVSWQKIFRLSRGTLFSLVAALSFGLAFANDAFIVRSFDVPSYLSLAFILPALAVWAVTPAVTVKIKSLLTQSFLTKLSWLGIIYAVSAITIFLAYQVGRNAAQIAPLNQTSTIITVVLAIIILKEKALLVKKLLGAALSFVGVMLVG